MSFLDNIASVLGKDAGELKRVIGDRVVEDSLDGGRALRTVLLCESPHHAEISHKHPLAGGSGRTVTKAFARNGLAGFKGRAEPIGCLLHYSTLCPTDGGRPDAPVLNSLGLMNVSCLPLDCEAYCLDARRQYSELLCYLEAVKLKLEKMKPGAGLRYLTNLDDAHLPSRVYAVLRGELIRRLNELGSDVVVVPAGRIAQAFFDWAIAADSYQGGVEPYDGPLVPHPARDSWKREKYSDAIKKLVQVLERGAIAGAAR